MLYTLWHPFFRSYEIILPSSLTKVLPRVLGFSPRLPVSVYGTGIMLLDSAFSWQCGIDYFATYFSLPITPQIIKLADLPTSSTYVFGRTFPTVRSSYPSVSPHRSYNFWWYGNLNPLSITYALQPWLRPRLTLRGRTFLRKP